MIGAAGQNATATVFANQQELDDHLFSGVYEGQTRPPGEAADIQQFGAVEENVGSSNPGDFVAYNLSMRGKPLLKVERISGIVHFVAIPGNSVAIERLWPHGFIP